MKRSLMGSQPLMWDAPEQQPWYRQPGYRPTNFLMDAAAKFVGQPIADGVRGIGQAAGIWQDPNAPKGYVTKQALMKGANGIAGGQLAGSVFSRAPAGALRSGAASNSNLDMSQAARLERAKAMGFDTDNVMYHGTENRFDKFDEFQIGSSNDSGALGSGFYFTDAPRIANWYAGGFDGSNVKPTLLNTSNMFTTQGAGIDHGFSRGANKTLDLLTDLKSRHPEVVPKNADLPSYARDISDHPNSGASDEVRTMLDRAGYNGVKYKFDDGGVEVVSFDPSNIRSVNAAFDPAKRDSSNLLAADPFAGAIVPAFGAKENKKKKRAMMGKQ